MTMKRRYELLAMALSYPAPDLMLAVEKGYFDEVFGKSVPIPASLEELEVEYCRLFVGPGHVDVPPYESVYRGQDIAMQSGLVMGQAALDVKKDYYQAGLQLADTFTDMPDHVAVEVLFLAYLEAMAETTPGGNFLAQKRRFIKDHLGQWVSPFAEAVQQKSRLPWYAFASGLLKETVQTELEALTT
jgi:TorA maturation chaperone TorD